MWARGCWAWSATCVLWAGAVRAEVKEPDATSIPRPSNGGEVQLSTLFANQSETIDFVVDGFPTPDTFSPLCDFKATMMLKESGSDLAVGWYNVDPNATQPPANGDIHTIFGTGSGNDPGKVVTGADIRNDPNYEGGLIGFALIRNPPHFSQAKLNTYCSGCTNPGNWILSVSYRSTKLPNAYYVAFEDGDTTASGWNNDGDFNDYVMLFEGLACAGDGQPCEVPDQRGVCKDGIKECNNTGALVCRQITQASDEKCDSLDNDCDGETDEGDDLCQNANLVCSRGQCVPKCGNLEFECLDAPFTECDGDVCVDPKCKGKTCDAGKVCVAGECKAACDGVTCPVGQACRFGVCIDPCAGVTCGDQLVCVGGACVLDCACGGCAAGATCDATTRVCIDDDCVGKTCGEGQYCAADGSCADACANASCPLGDICKLGQCMPKPADADAGMSGSRDGDGGANAGSGHGHADAGVGGDAGAAGGVGGGAVLEKNDSGCGCRVPFARNESSRGKLLFGLAVLGLAARRRRRR